MDKPEGEPMFGDVLEMLCSISWLSLAELWYNSAYHAALGCSPFKALYGYEPTVGAAPTLIENTSTLVAEVITNREAHLQSIEHHLAQAQNHMKVMAD
jgi:hypothetical protein